MFKTSCLRTTCCPECRESCLWLGGYCSFFQVLLLSASDSQPGALLPPKGHSVTSGDLFGWHSSGGMGTWGDHCWHLVGREAKDSAEYPTAHRTFTHSKEFSGPKYQSCWGWETPLYTKKLIKVFSLTAIWLLVLNWDPHFLQLHAFRISGCRLSRVSGG